MGLLDSVERLRDILLNIFLVCALVCMCVGLRVLFVLADDIHQMRIEQAAQSVALRTDIRLNGVQDAKQLQDINVSLQALLSRMDDQLTDTRIAIQRAGTVTKDSTVQQIAKTREALADKLDETAQTIAAVAEKTEPPKSPPIEVKVPEQHPIIIPDQPPAITIPEQPNCVAKLPRKKSWIKRFWSWLWK